MLELKRQAGNLSQIAEIKAMCGDNLHIYSGNDDQVLPTLSVGGMGVISVISNIAPKKLIKALFMEVNPIPVKAALNIMGYDYGVPRLPLVEMSEENKGVLKNAMKNYGLL